MIGQLPQTLKVCNKECAIRTDYRNILKIISAFNDDTMTDEDKAYICLRRIYKRLSDIPQTKEGYSEALKAATDFIECRLSADGPSPKVVNWEKDEQLIFPAINKVAGTEVRALDYMHWWTFLGYFQAIDREDLWGFVLLIRQKKAKGKPLEKHEKEFYAANRDLCSIEYGNVKKTPEDLARSIFEDLIKAKGEGGNE